MKPEYLDNELVWYGILHVNGNECVKRYNSWGDYKEAVDSDFTRYVTRLFESDNSANAMAEARRLIRYHLQSDILK